jgi:hypothetical protein
MITHFSNKAFLVTFERVTASYGCRKYVLAGIRNKRIAAETLMSEVEDFYKKSCRTIENLRIQEVQLNLEHDLFSYEY